MDNGTRGHASAAEQVKILDYSPAARLDYQDVYSELEEGRLGNRSHVGTLP